MDVMRARRVFLSIPALFGLLTLSLIGCDRNPRDPVILSLGKQTVRRSHFDRYLQGLEAREVDVHDPVVRRSLLDTYVEERVLVLEARARGFLSSMESEEEEERAVRRLVAEVICSDPSPTESEIAEYYANHTAEFRSTETATVSHILVPTENEARDIRRRLSKDPKEFGLLARTRSRSPDAANGGLLGDFKRGELPKELEAAVFALQPGTATQIVSSPHGFHVIRVDARTPTQQLSLEDCRDRIREMLNARKCDQATRDFVRSLLDRAKVRIDDA
ncbi:MAG: peptidyl-prolyl cis-trans isomerase [Vicinamibacteria bacterium]|nr:peptidyl-prolyl cis-trans isomerase [Vicinamibacteria bacterium]